jgi:hypothetical protein
LAELSSVTLKDIGQELRGRDDLQTVTDDNMATEFKRHRWQAKELTWRALFDRCK